MDILKEREMCVDNMSDTMEMIIDRCIENGNEGDAVAVMTEWVVDGIDPELDDYVFLFMDNLTLEVE